jgi:nucleoside-diphosphate-sugar epimerase
MHRVLITGGSGFLGQAIAQQLLEQGTSEVILTDIVNLPRPSKLDSFENLSSVVGDLCCESAQILEAACAEDGSPPDAIIILHGIMSGKAESDFELGMAVNLDGTRSLLESLRRKAATHSKISRVLFASSLAVYGPPYPSTVSEDTKPHPRSSYGTAKAVCEILMGEYSRRKFIDGLTLRFPTISVRPGVPAPAASAFLSGIIREPFNGIETELPIDDDNFESWICSPAMLTANICHALNLLPDQIPEERVVNLPGVVVSIADMLGALGRHGGNEMLKLVKRTPDPATERILRSWPVHFNTDLAQSLGFKADDSFDQIVEQYVQYLKDQQ